MRHGVWMILVAWFGVVGTASAQQGQPVDGGSTLPPGTEPAGEQQRVDGVRSRPTTPAMMASTGATRDGKAVAFGDGQVIAFQVSAPTNSAFAGVEVDLTRLGKQTRVRLSDDGTNANDVAYDGIWEGNHWAEYSRYATVRLFGVDAAGDRTLLYSGVERTEDKDHTTLGWRVIQIYDDLTAMRTPMSYPGNMTEVHVSIPLITAFGWGIFVLVYIGLVIPMVRRRETS